MTRFSVTLAIGLLAVGLDAVGPQADTQVDVLFASAQYKETTEGDLAGAIDAYAQVAAQAGLRRALAASALVRMATCHEKLGTTDEARTIYERVVSDYADQREPAIAAQAKLAAMAVGVPSPAQIDPDALRTELLWSTDRSVSQQGVSLDGRFMTYVDWSDFGNLAIHDFTTGESRRLTRNADNGRLTSGGGYAGGSRISPDGKWVVYDWARASQSGETGELRLLPLAGNSVEPRTVWSPADGNHASLEDWFPSGDRVAAVVSGSYENPGTQRIITVSIDNGEVRQVRSFDWGSRGTVVRVSPDGRNLAFSRSASREAAEQDIFIVTVDGTSESTVVRHAANDRLVAWAPNGTHLLFNSDRSGQPGLWAQQVQNGQPVGVPRLLLLNVDVGTGMGVTREGTLHYAVRVNHSRLKTAELDLTTGSLLRRPIEAVERFVGSNGGPALSPDGEALAYMSARPGGTAIVFRTLETGEERDLIPLGLQSLRNLRWSPNGSLSVTGRDGLGRQDRFVVDVTTGQTRPMEGGFLTPDGTVGTLTPDGTQILHRDTSKNPNGVSSLYSYRVADGSVHALPGDFPANSGGFNSGGSFFLSPDGQWIATIGGRPTSDERDTSGTEMRLHGVAEGDGRVLATAGDDEYFGRWATWTPDSRALLVLKRDPQAPEGQSRLWVIPVDGSAPVATELVYQPTAGGRPTLVSHPDGRRIFYMEGRSSEQFWALHNLGLD